MKEGNTCQDDRSDRNGRWKSETGMAGSDRRTIVCTVRLLPPYEIRYDTLMFPRKINMNPEQSLYWSIAALFGVIALLMLVLAGPEPIVIWFLVFLPMWCSSVMYLISRWWNIQEQKWAQDKREWEDREWEWKRERNNSTHRESASEWNAAQWKSEAEYWKTRAIRAEGATSLWKATASMAGGAGRGSTGSLSVLAKACGSRKTLISLLHPDRHRNSMAANSATAYVMKHLPK